MTLICDKNRFGTKKLQPEISSCWKKIIQWLDAHKYSDYNVAIYVLYTKK